MLAASPTLIEPAFQRQRRDSEPPADTTESANVVPPERRGRRGMIGILLGLYTLMSFVGLTHSIKLPKPLKTAAEAGQDPQSKGKAATRPKSSRPTTAWRCSISMSRAGAHSSCAAMRSWRETRHAPWRNLHGARMRA